MVAAFVVAICADAMEMGLSLFLSEGFVSPFDDVLDVIVGIILTLLLGWHLAFLPSFAIKLIPVADIAPTWTLAVFIATRSRQSSSGSTPDNSKLLSPPIIPEQKQPDALPGNRD